jgi:hypothetical protein
MRMDRRLALALAALAGLTGCRSAKLSCDLLADPTNCWAEAAAALDDCIPDDETGVLAPDRASCTFSDGAEVVFDEPLPNDTIDLETFGFTVEVGGETCGRFVDTFMNRMELTAGGPTVVSELHSSGNFHLHCPGTTYSSSFDHLFDCAAMAIPAPTDGFSVDADLVTFLIASVSTPGEMFRCAPAP